MSFAPWVTVPVKDIHIDLPLSIHDTDIRIMFRNTDVIDKTIEQLKNLKKHMIENGLEIR